MLTRVLFKSLLIATGILPVGAFAQTGAAQRPDDVQTEPLPEAAVPPSSFTALIGTAGWSGHFGAPTNTTIATVVISARYRYDGLRVSGVMPYMRIESDGSFFTGIGGTPLFVAPQIRPQRRVRNGWGDLTLGASYLLPGADSRGFDLDLIGRVKLPTASDSSGLSTGKIDYSGGVELSKTLGSLTPTASVTYRVFGDTDNWQFNNGIDVTAGGSYTITPGTTLVLNYEYVQAASSYVRDSHEVIVGASTIAMRRLRVTGYASKGLSEGAANISGGVSLSVTF